MTPQAFNRLMSTRHWVEPLMDVVDRWNMTCPPDAAVQDAELFAGIMSNMKEEHRAAIAAWLLGIPLQRALDLRDEFRTGEEVAADLERSLKD